MVGELLLGPSISMLKVGWRGWPRAAENGGGATGMGSTRGGRES
jgi:hypothetical protein